MYWKIKNWKILYLLGYMWRCGQKLPNGGNPNLVGQCT